MSAMTLIQHYELTGSQSSITLSSIPATYTDLLVLTAFRVNRDTTDWRQFYVQFNNDTTGANYQWVVLDKQGAFGVYSSTASNNDNALRLGASVYRPAASYAPLFSNNQFLICDYTSTGEKQISAESITENTDNDQYISMSGGAYKGTSAISSIKFIDLNDSNFDPGSTVTIYGILAGSSGTTTVS